ncbi:Endothelial cell-specific molecule 1 [Branchiostoma belcheri]|nr:Endothelial cell-specific molecule 1 [Branchiostoma belcheri]
MELSVSVPENVAVGETIFTLPWTKDLAWTQAEEKAELPCAKMAGDPYDRFNVTENCTVWVANPLDWSVQSVYLLNIRHNARIKVELTDVEGYPPVYNETCETPINRLYRPGQILFSITVSGASMTTNAGLVVFQRTYSTIPEIWIYVTIEPWMLHTENSDCNILEDTQGDTFNTTFVLNITNCPPNRKGAQCDERCDCQHEASCDRWAGCVCPPGWTGTRCQTKCPHGTYGKDCAKDCICLNGASCGPIDGRCNCTGGWFGKDCSRPCRDGRYGWGCRQDCTCENNAKCDSKDGSCVCVSPWTGRNCDKYMNTYAPLLESLVPLGSLVLLVVIVTAILYKTGVLNCSVPDAGEEEKILFELKKMEQDLAQSLQPGWLGRWEKKIRHLTPGPLIGEGMFGKVSKAQLRTPKGELAVAAKTVRLEDSQSFRDFYREAAILVDVHQERCDDVQSNIVRLVGLITKSEEKYILLEYAPKGDLLGYLRRPRADQEELLGSLLTYAVHIARALQELARLRIAHRDVAARNVLITADNVAKLADFGLARDVYTTTQYVRANREGVDELLPLTWMALESIETGEYTCQSDVWSFGVLLWEIATLGQDPCYDGRIQLSFLQMVGILRQGIRMTRPPGCPEDLYQLMRACWRDVPDTRPTPDGLEQYLSQLILTLLPHEVIEMETTV